MATVQNPMLTETRVPLEPAGPDFPYYHEAPPSISPAGWLLVLGGVVAGFAALVTPLGFADTVLTGWLRVVLGFVGLPLLGLALATPGHWQAIFGRVGGRELRLMFAFAFANIVISFAVGAAVKTFGTAAANNSIADAGNLTGAGLVNFFAKVGVQLLGEELITILPFLAILAFCHHRLGMGRKAAVITAWLVSALAFGLAHLPTYDWNWIQCIVVIGSARLVLSWAYVWTKNIWVSTGAHILNDWLLIGFTVFLPRLLATA